MLDFPIKKFYNQTLELITRYSLINLAFIFKGSQFQTLIIANIVEKFEIKRKFF
jgi:hypothetical protein